MSYKGKVLVGIGLAAILSGRVIAQGVERQDIREVWPGRAIASPPLGPLQRVAAALTSTSSMASRLGPSIITERVSPSACG